MNSKHSTCNHAASGCNWPEGDCLGLCTPVQMIDGPIEIGELDHAICNLMRIRDSRPGMPIGIDSCECNEIPAPTSPIEGWGWVLRVFNRRVGI